MHITAPGNSLPQYKEPDESGSDKCSDDEEIEYKPTESGDSDLKEYQEYVSRR